MGSHESAEHGASLHELGREAFASGYWTWLPVAFAASLALAASSSLARRWLGRTRKRRTITLGDLDVETVQKVVLQVRQRIDSCTGTAQPDIVSAVQELIRGAMTVRASDIHFSPLQAGLQVTYRVHGTLHEVTTVLPSMGPLIVNRIKVMSRLDLHVRSTPQDGRLVTSVGNSIVEARVSTLPTEGGERVVLRLVRGGRSVPELESLGFSEHVVDGLHQLLAKPQGLVFVTGPVGSGKTTTLYAVLDHISRSRGSTTSLVTLEDPIELELPFATQTQMRAKAGMTFASALRSVLRQDPNVLMLGEIRDPETADIAMQAALTGHLILTTVHADGAAGPFARLIDMKIEPFLLASGTIGSLSQRLVRTLCPACRTPAHPEEIHRERLSRLGHSLPEGAYFEPKGCELCEMQGFVGRAPIAELLIMDGPLRDVIHRCQPTDAIRQVAFEQGMVSLLGDGLRLAQKGETSLTEVLRVAG
jgi:general secretion pathway protein E